MCIRDSTDAASKLFGESTFTIVPDYIPIENNIANYAEMGLETDDYSKTSKGDDPSEIFDIHEYHDGDKINRIHWKLTAKQDKTMVKDYSLPISNSIVLMADLQSEYNRKIMEGIIRQANILNYDVMAYSMFSNHDIDYPFQTGEENIFELFDPDKADGIIIYSESFRKGEVKEKITSVCRGSGLPYVEMDKYDGSEFRIWNDREIFSRLVSLSLIHISEPTRP